MRANGNVVDAHYGCVLGHLMNNSYRLGTEAPFSAKAARFGDREVGPAERQGRAVVAEGRRGANRWKVNASEMWR